MTLRAFEQFEPDVHPAAWVDDTALVIGNVTLAEAASIWPHAVIRGDVQRVEIGARTNIQDGCVLHVSHDSRYTPGGTALSVGEDVTVGHRAVLHGCTVESGAFIGIGAVVLDNAVIRSRTMLGAGALVPPGRELEGGYLWVGQPARRVRALSDRELEAMEYSAAHYVRLMRRHAGE